MMADEALLGHSTGMRARDLRQRIILSQCLEPPPDSVLVGES
jgi:hypothetical protein